VKLLSGCVDFSICQRGGLLEHKFPALHPRAANYDHVECSLDTTGMPAGRRIDCARGSRPDSGPSDRNALLFAWLLLRGGPSPELDRFSGNLLSWLALLFVPAATGLVVGLNQLATDWWRIALAIVGSTVAGLATTAWVMNSLDSMFSRSRKQP
jgi:holin-like protein